MVASKSPTQPMPTGNSLLLRPMQMQFQMQTAQAEATVALRGVWSDSL